MQSLRFFGQGIAHGDTSIWIELLNGRLGVTDADLHQFLTCGGRSSVPPGSASLVLKPFVQRIAAIAMERDFGHLAQFKPLKTVSYRLAGPRDF